MSQPSKNWATNRVNATIRKVCAEYTIDLRADHPEVRRALALELRQVVAECAAIVEGTDVAIANFYGDDDAPATLASAAARISAAFPDREGV